MVGNFGKVAERLADKAQEVVMVDMLKPAIECTEKVKAKEQAKITDPSMIPDEFKEYGKQGNIQSNVVEVNEQIELPFK